MSNYMSNVQLFELATDQNVAEMLCVMQMESCILYTDENSVVPVSVCR